jgi:hypothetical protein
MTPVVWMIASTVGSWLLVAVATDVGVEVLGGLLGPLVAACASWVAADRVFRRAPERLTAVMVAAFAGKMVFFGAYVTIALAVVRLDARPFVIGFTSYFIALHLMEALFLRRLFARGGRPSG